MKPETTLDTRTQNLSALNANQGELLCILSSLLTALEMEVVKRDYGGGRTTYQVVRKL